MCHVLIVSRVGTELLVVARVRRVCEEGGTPQQGLKGVCLPLTQLTVTTRHRRIGSLRLRLVTIFGFQPQLGCNDLGFQILR